MDVPTGPAVRWDMRLFSHPHRNVPSSSFGGEKFEFHFLLSHCYFDKKDYSLDRSFGGPGVGTAWAVDINLLRSLSISLCQVLSLPISYLFGMLSFLNNVNLEDIAPFGDTGSSDVIDIGSWVLIILYSNASINFIVFLNSNQILKYNSEWMKLKEEAGEC